MLIFDGLIRLVQCSKRGALNEDSCFFYAQYQRLVVPIGVKKACVAVAHLTLIAVYHVLSGYEFRDLGADYYAQFNKEKKIQPHLKQLQRLGWEPSYPAIASWLYLSTNQSVFMIGLCRGELFALFLPDVSC